MKKKSPASQVKAIRGAYEKAVERQGEAFRKDYLIPFCDKYGATFKSGGGAWIFFLNRSTEYGENLLDPRVRRASRIPASEMKAVFDALMTPLLPFGYGSWNEGEVFDILGSAGTLGYVVRDYDTRKR